MDPKSSDVLTSATPSTVEAILTSDADARPVIPRPAAQPSGTAFRSVPAEHAGGGGYPGQSQSVGRPWGDQRAPNEVLPAWTTEAGPDEADANVWIHIYHVDPYTGWLNWALLKNAEMPIYHTGVEVYGDEWAFNYFDDCWDDPSVSGVINCLPKNMPGYEYQESLCLGPTRMSEDEVDRALYRLRDEWPACTYHLTRRNCLSFAQTFVGILRPPVPFPAEVGAVNEASRNNPIHEGIVDYGWSWAKWWMRRKYEQEQAEEAANREAAIQANLRAQH